ncbi:hypothetical protein [Paraliobacillus sediminis]|uniref:hypothetical protein n=1 Tax=Paraliobacillus sediminis TaxID=1885916 RepID=UPI000E3E380E|nr:hypothetical protein [Paraliobacillus sediminis]
MSLIEDIEGLIIDAEFKNLKNFNKYSLLVKANDISKEHYKTKTDDFIIDPAGNIPEQFRLPVEIVSSDLRRDRIVNMFEGELKNVVVEDYFIRTISILDILLEEIYSAILRDQGKEERKISEEVGFSPKKLPHVLLAEIPKFKTFTNSKGFGVVDYFYIYEIYRQYRHAIIHSNGTLNERHLKKIKNTCTTLTSHTGQEFKYEDLMFIKDNKIELTLEGMAILRHWVITFSSSMLTSLSK